MGQKKKVLGMRVKKITERISRGTNKMHAKGLGRQAGRKVAGSKQSTEVLRAAGEEKFLPTYQ